MTKPQPKSPKRPSHAKSWGLSAILTLLLIARQVVDLVTAAVKAADWLAARLP